MMKKMVIWQAVLVVLISGTGPSFGQQTIPAGAQRYFDRGIAAVEMAKSPADYEAAIKEFGQAASLAPNWPDAYYNLGMVQEKAGKYRDAISSLKQYLRFAPDASNANTVRSLINRLEYKNEQEDGFKKVYEKMTYSRNISVMPHVTWKLISKKGNNEYDWEIERQDDLDNKKLPQFRRASFFIMKQGALYKKSYSVVPMQSYLRPTEYGHHPVKVNGRVFEYRYPVEMNWIIEYTDGIPVYDYKSGGELSIKGEIVSVEPTRIKREQTVKWPDGRLSVTEFVYELTP